MCATPLFLQKPAVLIRKIGNCKSGYKCLETASIVHRSSSPWASTLHMVPKKDGSWHSCGDYCHLNLISTPDKYPLPNIQDLSNSLDGCMIFSKIDLVNGYLKFLLRRRTSQKQQSLRHLACLNICLPLLCCPCRTDFSTNDESHHRRS
jgi:hypothetical protein